MVLGESESLALGDGNQGNLMGIDFQNSAEVLEISKSMNPKTNRSKKKWRKAIIQAISTIMLSFLYIYLYIL